METKKLYSSVVGSKNIALLSSEVEQDWSLIYSNLQAGYYKKSKNLNIKAYGLLCLTYHTVGISIL